jgi:hypothetical protein
MATKTQLYAGERPSGPGRALSCMRLQWPGRQVGCGRERQEGENAFDLAFLLHPAAYTDDIEDYRELCKAWREGSDLTIIFHLKAGPVFEAAVSHYLDDARKQHPDLSEGKDDYEGVSIQHLTTPDQVVRAKEMARQCETNGFKNCE